MDMKIEVSFLAGTEIVEALLEAKALARRLDLAYVTFDFNDKHISVSQEANIQEMVKQYEANVKRYIID